MIAAARNRVRWTWNRARYVAQTEGTATLARRALAMTGLAAGDAVPEQVLLRPAPHGISAACAAAWPLSVLVLGPPGDGSPAALRLVRRARQLAKAGVAVTALEPGQQWRSAAQLAAALLIHPPSWEASLPAILQEAHRLRQTVLADLDDAGAAAPAGADILVVAEAAAAAALRSRLPDAAVHVVGLGEPGAALAELLTEIGGIR